MGLLGDLYEKRKGGNGSSKAAYTLSKLLEEIATQYVPSDSLAVKYLKMLQYIMRKNYLHEELKVLPDEGFQRKEYAKLLLNLDYGGERQPKKMHGDYRDPDRKYHVDGSQLYKADVKMLWGITLPSEFDSFVSVEDINTFCKLNPGGVERLEAEYHSKIAKKKNAEVNAAADAARGEEVKRAEKTHLNAVYHKSVNLENVIKKGLEGRMLPITTSAVQESNQTRADVQYLTSVEEITGLRAYNSMFSANLDELLDDGDDEAAAIMHKGDGDRGLCNALARSMWGDELYSWVLDSAINHEIVQNRDW
jgi:hypothetical protein